ncbi:hypothetical protein FACS1894166_11940 [Bacilli bacterium]|nr:hypothetical protein FACS1894166_11940 [Bacilli bacterium]
MTGSDNEINSERFTKFLSLRPNNEFTFPIAQYGVLFGKNSLDLRYDGPPSMNSVTGTEYTTISQQDVDGTNETLKSILEGANVKNLDIH